MPKPEERFCFGTMRVTAAFKMDSCAPMPMPHRATPRKSAQRVVIEKMGMEKGAASNVESMRTWIPRY